MSENKIVKASRVIAWPGSYKPKHPADVVGVLQNIETCMENHRELFQALAERPAKDPYRKLAVSTLNDFAYELRRILSRFPELSSIQITGDSYERKSKIAA